jgi:hypothetical protein
MRQFIWWAIGAAAVVAIPLWCSAQQSRESRWSLVFRGLMHGGDHYFAQIDSKWLAEGDSIQSNGGRIEIEQITLDHIVIFSNGTERFVRLGESLSTPAAIQGSENQGDQFNFRDRWLLCPELKCAQDKSSSRCAQVHG